MRCFLILLIALLCACTESNNASWKEGPDVNIAVDSLFGMMRISSKGKVSLGTNNTSAKSNERPEMKVELDYDFSIGRYEVRCDEFNKLMRPSIGLSLKCAYGNYPATDLTYYDAVLYANERSKSEGFDTAYTYVSARFDEEKHCTNLEGFAFHPEANAFRLPTEAEWVLVASANWSPNEAWVAENSDYKLHEVCRIAGNNAKICDMFGNALEWVNDWNGDFRDTVLTNYVGAPDGGSLGLRVVKGGSYRNSFRTINLYNRGDVYTVTSATRADYVGFRLAFGTIPNPVWMGSNGSAVSSRVAPLANASIVRTQTGTSKVKLAFRNDLTGNLAYIDFSSGTPTVIEIVDTVDVYHPEISPNGKKVAFCTKIEGIAGPSELYVRDLNANGINFVKLDVPSAAIPRWRVLSNGDTVIVYVTDVGNNKEESSFKSASTWQVKFANGQFGVPQKLFDGAYHGGISTDETLAVTGARLLRARIAPSGKTVVDGLDTIWYGGEQACNASLAKDSTKRTLFLDFGGQTGQSFAGVAYGTHERLLIADSTGSLIQSVGAPSGFSFDHSEWATGRSGVVVATLANINGAHTKIVMINTADNSIIDLAEGDELWHPSLWIDKGLNLGDDLQQDLDSAGVYFKEDQEWAHISLGYKMSMLWRYRDSIEILCVGSSRTENSLMVTAITSGFAQNMGHSGNDLDASLYVAENYGLNHLKKLKYIVVSIDIDLWQSSTEFTELIITNQEGFVYDQNHGFWVDGYPDWFLDAVEEAAQYSEIARMIYEPSRGFFSDEGVAWGPATVEQDSNWGGAYGEAKIKWNLERLRGFIAKTAPLKVKVIGLIFPLNPGYRNTGSYGRYGPRRSEAMRILDSLNLYQREYPNFILMDENKNGNHDYPDKCALNTDHLSIQGASKVTLRLDSLLKTLK